MTKHVYNVTIILDDDYGIVNVRCTRPIIPGVARFETAWPTEMTIFDDDGTTALHPNDGHEVMTYSTRDQAIGEAMTSLRDNFDKDDQYRS